MMMFIVFITLALCAASTRVAKETDVRRAFPPAGWTNIGVPRPSDKIALIFALKQYNLRNLEETLLRVSDPTSADYGQHLSFHEVHELTAPPRHAIEKVLAFLRSYHATKDMSHHPQYGMIRTIVPISVAEQMLETNYSIFRHEVSGLTVVRTDSYSLPDDVAHYINIVGPTIRFPPIKELKVEVDVPLANTPASLRALYSVGDVEGKSTSNRQACTAFLKQYMSSSDLQTFYKEYYPVAEGRTPTINGPNPSSPIGVEANLDIQYITAMGGGVPTEFDSFNGTAPDNPANEPFLDMLYYLGNNTNPPWVVSTSYGEDETSVSMDYANSCNTEFQKNGARGISILFSSGDSGVGSDTGSCTRFVAQWPAASPYITAVGGTTGTPETGAGLSGGGFSDRWPQQTWQASAIKTFLSTSTSLPDASRYNASGRGFPDVAAQATGFAVVYNGNSISVAGTSCSCPTFSGIVGLLNDIRFQAKKSPLGFLNPLLYSTAVSTPNIFQDITSGHNPGCGTQGFTAIAGWDPVTGYGTPNYANLAKVVASLP